MLGRTDEYVFHDLDYIYLQCINPLSPFALWHTYNRLRHSLALLLTLALVNCLMIALGTGAEHVPVAV